jgi:hypothetical protein
MPVQLFVSEKLEMARARRRADGLTIIFDYTWDDIRFQIWGVDDSVHWLSFAQQKDACL